MRVLKILSLVGAMIAGTTAANAVPVGAGQVINMTAEVTATTDRTAFTFTDFMIGETVNIQVVMSNPVTSSGGTLQNRFFSASGGFVFTGQTSGTVLTFDGGIETQVRAGIATFRSIDQTGIYLHRWFDIELEGSLFSVTNDFATYLAQFTGGETSGAVAQIFTDEGTGMSFASTTVIPLPAGGLLLLGGLGALAVRRKMAA